MTALISLAAAHEPRTAEVSRDTAETKIKVRLNLDGTGESKLATGIGFFDHMLDQIARHGLIDLDVQCEGDLHIDGHHTVEDVGIAIGQAVRQAVGDKRGLTRYGHSYVPLDEALSRVVSISRAARVWCWMRSSPAARSASSTRSSSTSFFRASSITRWSRCTSTT